MAEENKDQIEEFFTDQEGTIEKKIVQQINNAKTSLKVMTYDFTSEAIASAIVAAHKRGVKVEIISDKKNFLKNGKIVRSRAMDAVLSEGISDVVVDFSRGISHNKVMIIDDKDVINGSYNFTLAAALNRENLTIFHGVKDTADKFITNFYRVKKECVEFNKYEKSPERYKVLNGYTNDVMYKDGIKVDYKKDNTDSSLKKPEFKGRLETDKTPAFVPYQTSFNRKKTKDGIKEVGKTLKRYYSSIDMELYFGNQYVEDICDITYNVNQNSLPIYGYNSYTYDDLAVGSRIVQGSFAIRFTSPNYLFKLLQVAQTAHEAPIVEMESYVVPVHEFNPLLPNGKATDYYNGMIAGTKGRELYPQTFDIDIVYGGHSDVGEATHIIIEDVRILSAQMGSSIDSPMPLTEVYSFVARDIKTYVGHKSAEKKEVIAELEYRMREYNKSVAKTAETPNKNEQEKTKYPENLKKQQEEIKKDIEKKTSKENITDENEKTQESQKKENNEKQKQ